jgi:hypothetical protein
MAAEFRSPRFMGDPVLKEILRDPDTGTRKLGTGSPERDSVQSVQQALFDLRWTQRIDTPVPYPSQFVIGIFGPITSKNGAGLQASLRHPLPAGRTNLVGPRTLDLLDSALCGYIPRAARPAS